MRAALVLTLAAAAWADDAGIAKAQGIAKAGPAAAREAIPDLIEIGKGSAWERFAARDALAVAGPPAIGRLIEGASGDGSLRLLLEGVSFDLGAGVVAPALPLLASEDPKVRAMAAVSLGAAGKGGEAAVKKLIEALYDKDASVRREAATALGLIGRGAHDAIPGLILLADDRERGTTREAILAMGMILRDAAEREQPARLRAMPVSHGGHESSIGNALEWLKTHQEPEGSWQTRGAEPEPAPPDPAAPSEPAPADAAAHKFAERDDRLCVASLALLAMLESGAPEACASQLRSGLRYLVANAPADAPALVAAALCAAARVLDEPECRLAARDALATIVSSGDGEPDAWRSLAILEAEFAGVPFDRSLRGSDELREPALPTEDPEQRFLATRARQYAGKEPLAFDTWEEAPLSKGPAHVRACMLLCWEAASGLTHPLTMPLPDAPQFKAAVATLRIAAQSKDAAIRGAAQQALAGFAVR